MSFTKNSTADGRQEAGSNNEYVVEVRGVVKKYGQVTAVNGVSFGVRQGKMVTLLGPSGCGKTTLLRAVAGLEQIDEGDIYIGSKLVTSVSHRIMLPPEKRGVGLVFQSYAIWPHMTVFDNTAYPLTMMKLPRKDIKERTLKVLGLVGLSGYESRRATDLSGGQQQRVALARSLVYEPKLLLFDEPLSNLDAKLRENMRLELIRLQREVNITSVYVTHDQTEAMALSDEIIVMNHGSIVQRSTSVEIYRSPVNKFVADFIGLTNLIPAEIVEKSGEDRYGLVRTGGDIGSHLVKCPVPPEFGPGAKVILSVRPEDITIVPALSDQSGQGNTLSGDVANLVFLGNSFDCRVKVNNMMLRVFCLPSIEFAVGSAVEMLMSPENIVCLRA